MHVATNPGWLTAPLFAQVTIDVLHLSRLNVQSEYMSILVAAQCLLLWLKIQYFARYANAILRQVPTALMRSSDGADGTIIGCDSCPVAQAVKVLIASA